MKDKKTRMKICKISDVKQLRSMSVESRFNCAKCGAKSHDKSYLCEPVPYTGKATASR